MLKLLLDENVPASLAEALKENGFEVVRSQEVELQGEDDEMLISWATKHGFVVFTFDKATMAKAARVWAQLGREHSGLIICDQMPREAIGVIVRRLLNVAKVYTNETLKNVVLYLGAVWD